MRAKDLLNAMGKIDGRLIDEALETESESLSDKYAPELGEDEYYPESIIKVNAPPKKFNVLKWTGLAAAVSIFTAGAILLSRLRIFNGNDSNAASSGMNIALTASQTSEPLETESLNAVVTSEAMREILENGLPNVPLAELKPFDEFFTAEPIAYIIDRDIIPEFISDGRIFCTKYEAADEGISVAYIYCYEPENKELRELFIDTFPEEAHISYYFLCTYGDYIYFYRGASQKAEYDAEAYNVAYTDTASYTLCRASISSLSAQGLAEVTLEHTPYISDCVVCGQYMYFEEIAAADDETEGHTYNISRLNLEDCSVSTWAENARCPLLYRDKLVFYRNGAFWESELDDGFDARVMFYDTGIDFFKDRLCSDGNNIVLARSYIESRDGEKYSAFTIEVYDELRGFVPKALFTAEISSLEFSGFFSHTYSAPIISCADGLFGFLDIIFDLETDTFVQAVSENNSRQLSKVVMADGKIYCFNFFADWSAALPDQVTDGKFYLFSKKE